MKQDHLTVKLADVGSGMELGAGKGGGLNLGHKLFVLMTGFCHQALSLGVAKN